MNWDNWPVVREEHWYRITETNVGEVVIKVLQGEMVILTEGALKVLEEGPGAADGEEGEVILERAAYIASLLRNLGFDKM